MRRTLSKPRESGSDKSSSRLIGFFSRLNYDWKGKYLLMGSVRYEALHPAYRGETCAARYRCDVMDGTRRVENGIPGFEAEFLFSKR